MYTKCVCVCVHKKTKIYQILEGIYGSPKGARIQTLTRSQMLV